MTIKLPLGNRKLNRDSSGMVAIIVTIIMMLIISLTVLGFAQIIRSNQRQALDRQLSSQAFYAAESGINDARQIINEEYLKDGEVPPQKGQCGDTPEYNMPNDLPDDDIGNNTGVGYTCVLIDGSPSSLSYDLATTSPSVVTPIFTDGTIETLTFEWTSPDEVSPLAGCPFAPSGQFPIAASWSCGYGVLRVDLTPTPASSTFDRQTLMRQTFTGFFMPTTSNSYGTVSYAGSGNNIHGGNANQGAVAAANCDGSRCTMIISGLSGTRSYLRVAILYVSTKLKITAEDATGTALNFSGTQVLVDSTGKAADVLQRIQVRIPLLHHGLHADYGLETTDSICKQFSAFPSSAYTNNTPGC